MMFSMIPTKDSSILLFQHRWPPRTKFSNQPIRQMFVVQIIKCPL